MRFAITLAAALADWLIVAVTIWSAEVVQSFWCHAAAVIIIASRQHALGVIAHEAIHWPKGHLQRVAVLTFKYACAWPILMHFEFFREIHLAHHRHLNTGADPDFSRNRPGDLVAAESLWQIMRYVLGLNRRQDRSARGAPSGILKMSAGMLLFWCAGLSLVWIYGYTRIFLLYWLLPLFTWFIAVNRLRGILEHAGIAATVTQATRTTRGNIISNFLFLPHAIGMHGEHHRSPQTPFYRLKNLRSANADWHTSHGVTNAAFEVLAATAWFRRKFANRFVKKARASEKNG
ncbi:fatty acid desaturase [Turneriella parva]|uniref:Fatty acid desaturase n=1 Tax=Turneriella parva (strain ATCC BAA-1111 / DSM 21527 / NCTC 11395 / H) TaxID=869212 RepID=I4B847_TURPD|nr:fatty acid desaturase [Turneriella parva]AFM13454.1 fatty acid desaturase [Turneriella parva DSM 21527]